MYDIKIQNTGNSIIYHSKNEYNQTLRLEFNKWYFSYRNIEQWFVVFYISNKRKHGYKFLEQTGKDGIKSLLWAKKCLIDFINNEINKNCETQIVIYSDNERRRKIYEYGLKSLGFNTSTINKRLALLLIINK
jgi:hypothetical protein